MAVLAAKYEGYHITPSLSLIASSRSNYLDTIFGTAEINTAGPEKSITEYGTVAAGQLTQVNCSCSGGVGSIPAICSSYVMW